MIHVTDPEGGSTLHTVTRTRTRRVPLSIERTCPSRRVVKPYRAAVSS